MRRGIGEQVLDSSKHRDFFFGCSGKCPIRAGRARRVESSYCLLNDEKLYFEYI